MENKNLPNLVIIGAMKCGTSSLHGYLDSHPQIFMSRIKELNFFIEEENWSLGLDWYKSNFPENMEIVGESSPNYTKYPLFKDVPEKMSRLIPDAKLIYIVRDPIKRIVSHYIHRVADGLERRSFDEALKELKKNHLVSCSCYYMQLKRYLQYYQTTNILVLSLEELSRNRVETLRKIFCFLKVDPDFKHENFSQVLHTSSHKKAPTLLNLGLSRFPEGKLMRSAIFRMFGSQIASQWLYRPIAYPTINNALQQKLVDILSEDVNQLRAFTGYEFSDWSI